MGLETPVGVPVRTAGQAYGTMGRGWRGGYSGGESWLAMMAGW